MAKSSKRTYVPCDVNVHFGPSRDYPDGRVVSLKQGMVDLDEDVSVHPVVAHFASPSPGEAARQEAVAKATQARDEAVAKANTAYQEAVGEAEKAAAEENAKLAEEWGKRAEAAAAKGESFNEPHPDPATAAAVSLTRTPIGVVPIGGQLARTEEASAQMSGRQRPRLEDAPAHGAAAHPTAAHGASGTHPSSS